MKKTLLIIPGLIIIFVLTEIISWNKSLSSAKKSISTTIGKDVEVVESQCYAAGKSTCNAVIISEDLRKNSNLMKILNENSITSDKSYVYAKNSFYEIIYQDYNNGEKSYFYIIDKFIAF